VLLISVTPIICMVNSQGEPGSACGGDIIRARGLDWRLRGCCLPTVQTDLIVTTESDENWSPTSDRADRSRTRRSVNPDPYVAVTYYFRQGGYAFTWVCLSVCLPLHRITNKTTDRVLMELYGMVGHNPWNSRLDFGGNRDLESDPGIFEGILPLQHCQL